MLNNGEIKKDLSKVGNMSVDWSEIFRTGIRQLESDLEESWAAFDSWVKPFWDEESQSSQYYYNQGSGLYGQGKYSEAIARYTQAIEYDRKFDRAYYYRGVCHCESGRYKQGLQDLDKAIEIKPDFTDAYYYRGFVRKTLGDLIGAIADLTEVIKLDPDKIDAYFGRGTVFSGAGDYQNAVEDFSKLIDFAPTASKHYNRGVTYYQMAEYESAIADLLKAVELEPGFISAYLNLSNAYYAINNCQGATRNYRKAREIKGEIDPKDEHGYYAQGVAALNRENNKESREFFTKAAYLCRENNNLALHLKIVETMKDIDESE